MRLVTTVAVMIVGGCTQIVLCHYLLRGYWFPIMSWWGGCLSNCYWFTVGGVVMVIWLKEMR